MILSMVLELNLMSNKWQILKEKAREEIVYLFLDLQIH